MARYNVVEVRTSAAGSGRAIFRKNLTKGEASRVETAENEKALKAYNATIEEARERGVEASPPIVGYIVQPAK